jgi:20S proteasome alpha/beta subunit
MQKKKILIIISIFLFMIGCTDNSVNGSLEKEVTEMMGYESVEEFIDRAVDEAMKKILSGTEKGDVSRKSRKKKIQEIARQAIEEHRNNN